jgi:aldose 1-epimerase
MMTNIHQFGILADGRAVQSITIAAEGISATLLTWGAVLQDLRMAGVDRSLTLGSDSLADYEGAMRFHGSLIGPVVNRISDARTVISGQEYRFDANLDGRLTLHSGDAAGTHLKLWELVEAGPAHVVLGIALPDGEGGFPGNRRVTARFSVTTGVLRMEVSGESDAPTILNFANHSYWNLDGTESWAGHDLRIAADHWLPTNGDFCPTGEVLDVAGSAMDFREGRKISPGQPDLDNCFCPSDGPRDLREVLWLTGVSGVRMAVATTDPGVQVYDGRNAIRPGHGAYEGIAVECQGWPDASNHAAFPSILVQPGQVYGQVTEWRFRRG